MKKIFFIILSTIIISGCASQNVANINQPEIPRNTSSIKEITPFAHSLFITKDDLDNLGVSNYKYIKNESTTDSYKKNGDDIAFAATTIILPHENTFYPSIRIDIFKTGDETTAKNDFAIKESVTNKIGIGKTIKNYNNLGESNIFTTYEESISNKKYFLSLLMIQKKEYLFEIQVYNESSQKRANEIAKKIANFFLSKV